MNPYNPALVRELMADRERQIAKIMLSNEIRRAEHATTLTARQRRVWRPAHAIALVLGLLLASASWIHLETPPLTGDHTVGRQELILTDHPAPSGFPEGPSVV